MSGKSPTIVERPHYPEAALFDISEQDRQVDVTIVQIVQMEHVRLQLIQLAQKCSRGSNGKAAVEARQPICQQMKILGKSTAEGDRRNVPQCLTVAFPVPPVGKGNIGLVTVGNGRLRNALHNASGAAIGAGIDRNDSHNSHHALFLCLPIRAFSKTNRRDMPAPMMRYRWHRARIAQSRQ